MYLSKAEVVSGNPGETPDPTKDFLKDLMTTNGGYLLENRSGIQDPNMAYVGSSAPTPEVFEQYGHEGPLGALALSRY